MAITWPAKNNYATGDVLTAANMNGIGDDLNALFDNSFYAGKNKIINGNFAINQRAFTSTTTSNTYGFDRWLFTSVDGTCTYSAQTFTPGTAPVTGYEAANFARIQTSGQTLAGAFTTLAQRIESVRTFAGQTVTVSFWAKAASGTPKVAVELAQSFGLGGSPSAQVNNLLGTVTLSTAWTRYSLSIALPSISGKTIGTTQDGSLNLNLWISAGTDFAARTGSIGIQSNTFDFWGVQVEAGSTATPFQIATGTIQGELANCQRYYQRVKASTAYGTLTYLGGASTTTNLALNFMPIVTMRALPSSAYGGLIRAISPNSSVASAISAFAVSGNSNPNMFTVDVTTTGLTANNVYWLTANNDSTAYLEFSAEL